MKHRGTVLACLLMLATASSIAGKKTPQGCLRNPTGADAPSVVLSRLPRDYLDQSQLPKNFDWRNVNGTVYTTKIGNQLAPKFCGKIRACAKMWCW